MHLRFIQPLLHKLHFDQRDEWEFMAFTLSVIQPLDILEELPSLEESSI